MSVVLRTFGKTALAAGVISLLVGGLALLLSPRPSLYGNLGFSTVLYDRDGRLLRLSLAPDERYRLFVPLDRINQHVIDATLQYEDRYFRRHPGVNPVALARAAYTTYVGGERVVGASTITMQLARLRFALDTRSPPGKLVQIARALQLERHYSKDEILEAYLNLAPYGGSIEGAGTAAIVYFDKPAAALSLPEAAALAVIPQNPARRNPATDAGLAQIAAARDRLLASATFEAPASLGALTKLPLSFRLPSQLPFHAPHYSRFVTGQARHRDDVVTTTLELAVQRAIEQRIARYLDRNRRVGIYNASALLVDYRTMDVVASVGSAGFFDDGIFGQVDGTAAKRSPGSTLKPFVYGLAMDAGLIHPMSMLKDAPKRFGAYTPENFDRGFMGPVLAKDALVYSRNVPATELLLAVGQERFHEFLVAGGVSRLKDAGHYGLAAVLGGNELTMQELARLYAMLANGGEFRPLRYRQTAAPDSPPNQRVRRLLSPEASFLVLDMLRDNPRPGRLALSHDSAPLPVAWKTGTSYAYRDAWTAGVFGPYVLVVWIGNFDGSANPAFVGRKAAAPLFFEIADMLTPRIEGHAFGRDPDWQLNLRRVEICASTGDLPGRHCPDTTRAWFIPGVSPIRVSTVHRAVRVDTRTGRRACGSGRDHTREEVFEFWPSDLARLKRKAGISTRRPPPWDDRCALDTLAATGEPPAITSPASQLGYYLQADRPETATLPLTANTDADVESLFWFVNDSFVAEVAPDEPYLWTAEVGSHDILVVDDLGRSASHRLSVFAAQ